MKDKTDHLSFILKPSTIPGAGVEVFVLHGVKEGTHLAVFTEQFEEELRTPDDIPEALQGYCLDQEGGKILCPKYFNRMDIGNYLNHVKDKANLKYEKGKGYFAMRDIEAGEELLANYKELDEPENTHENYY